MPVRYKYNSRCKVCKYMKAYPYFRQRIYNSTRFNPDAPEGILDVVADNPGCPPTSAIYNHIKKNHMGLSVERKVKIAEAVIKQADEKEAQSLITSALEGEAAAALQKPRHVAALDNYIAQAEQLIKQGKIKITSQSFIAAVNARAAIDKGQKDRSADLIKTLAGLAAPKKQ